MRSAAPWNPDGGPREYYTQIGETTGHSPYGVYDMGGNLQEWTDTMTLPANRITRGGELLDPETALRNTSQQPYDPTTEGDLLGLRLALIIPEPGTVGLFGLGFAVLMARNRSGSRFERGTRRTTGTTRT